MLSVADKLRELRRSLGLTQPELAKRLKVSTVLISMVETGLKPISTKLISKLYKAGYGYTARDIYEIQADQRWQEIIK